MPQIAVGATADASVYEFSPNAPDGSNQLIQVWNQANILLKFDLSDIPSTATITGAALTLEAYTAGGVPTDMPLLIQRVSEDFDEAEVTFNSRFSGVPWSSPGGTAVADFQVEWDFVHPMVDGPVDTPDISELVQDAIRRRSKILRLKISLSTSSPGLNLFLSRETSDGPFVTVQYTCRLQRGTPAATTLSVTEEAQYGVYDATQEPIGIEFGTETLRNPRTRKGREHWVGSGRAARSTHASDEDPRGQITGHLQPHGFWPLVMKYLLGDAVTGSGVPYTHRMNGRGSEPVALTIQKQTTFRSADPAIFRYTGVRPNAMTLRARPGAFVRTVVDLIARREERVDEPMSIASYPPENEPFRPVGVALVIQEVGAEERALATISALDLTIRNELEASVRTIESGAWRRSLPLGPRIVTGSMTAFFTQANLEHWQRWSADLPVLIRATFASGPYHWRFTLPKLLITQSPTPQVAARGPMSMELPFRAFYSGADQSEVELVIANNDPLLSTGIA